MDGKYRNPYFIGIDPSWQSDSLKLVEIFDGLELANKFTGAVDIWFQSIVTTLKW